jgi:hypothetical protein
MAAPALDRTVDPRPADEPGEPRGAERPSARVDTTDYLGAGLVLDVTLARVRVRLEDGCERDATMALAFPYQPTLGDELLVLGKGERFFVVGLLSGQGRATLEFEGDVSLRSLTGKVEISAAEGVELRSRELSLYADKVRIVASALTETLSTCISRVRELWSVQAGESRTIVRGLSHTQAKQARIDTEEQVAINGKQVHLG